MRSVRSDDLVAVLRRIIEKLVRECPQEIELPGDLYRFIPTDQWDRFEGFRIDAGSLYDDLDELEHLVRDPKRPCTFVDFDRAASLLRAVSEQLNPADAQRSRGS
jgi:hypothetical protein